MVIHPLIWDSEFFGIRIAKVSLVTQDDVFSLVSSKSDLCKSFDLIYVFAPPGLSIPTDTIKVVDQKAVYSIILKESPDAHPRVIQWTRSEVSSELLDLALESGRHSRFKTDTRFPTGSYERLYTRWIDQSVKHIIASDVFVYMEGEHPRGMITLKLNETDGVIGLMAVDNQYQHQGLGSALMQQVFHYAFQQGVTNIAVATQLDNRAACRFYEKAGFSLQSVTNVFHWWL